VIVGVRNAAARARRGFTILELFLVLLLVTGVAAASIWAYFSRGDVTLANAAKLLVEDLRMTQARAAYQRAPMEFVFLTDGTGYHAGCLPPFDGVDDAPNRRFEVDAIFEGVRIGHTTLGTRNRIVFDAQGHPDADASITLVFRGEARTVLVRASDGTTVVADGP
jgi:type II secretory pathway pseudopilin PulG